MASSPREPLVVVASDSFKGTLSSAEVAAIVNEELRGIDPSIRTRQVVIADGGEGTLDALLANGAGELVPMRVSGPLGGLVEAAFALLGDGTAVVEMARSSGLTLVPERGRNPRLTTTRGTGELISAALDRGARRILVGLGGSATNDAGLGAMGALGVRFLDADGNELRGTGSDLGLVREIDARGLDARLDGAEVVVLADVDAPLVGPRGATRVFAPQKGADPACVEELERGMASYATVLDSWAKAHGGRAVSGLPGAGAAGGLGSALMAFLGARAQSGISFVLDAAGFDDLLLRAALCVTGEGRLDSQSSGGKAVSGVSARCAAAGVPCVAVVGTVEPGLDARSLGLAAAIACLAPDQAASLSGEELARGAEASLRAALRENAALLAGLLGATT